MSRTKRTARRLPALLAVGALALAGAACEAELEGDGVTDPGVEDPVGTDPGAGTDAP